MIYVVDFVPGIHRAFCGRVYFPGLCFAQQKGVWEGGKERVVFYKSLRKKQKKGIHMPAAGNGGNLANWNKGAGGVVVERRGGNGEGRKERKYKEETEKNGKMGDRNAYFCFYSPKFACYIDIAWLFSWRGLKTQLRDSKKEMEAKSQCNGPEVSQGWQRFKKIDSW